MSSAWFWTTLLISATVFIAVTGTLLMRRLIGVEVLERHNEVAGFIQAVIGIVYAVLLGFAAVTVWEAYDKARASVQQEADDLADLYRDAQTFPDGTRTQIEDQIREYVRLVIQKEWPAMAERSSTPEVWDAYTQLRRTYYQFQPEDDQQRIWYARSITKLNDLSDQRRLRLQSSRARRRAHHDVGGLAWSWRITIAFSFLFGTQSAAAQVVMSSGLAFTIALVMVMLAIIALEQPFAGISRIGPQNFVQLERVFEQLDAARSR